jgi:hypothetical protein
MSSQFTRLGYSTGVHCAGAARMFNQFLSTATNDEHGMVTLL